MALGQAWGLLPASGPSLAWRNYGGPTRLGVFYPFTEACLSPTSDLLQLKSFVDSAMKSPPRWFRLRPLCKGLTVILETGHSLSK